jgi:hypothetical protein
MGLSIRSFANFQSQFNKVAEPGALYACFLYATTGDHQQVATFIQNQKYYFNELAQNSNTYLFFFDEGLAGSPGKNPSAVVAGLFKISLAELPGVLVFADVRENVINDGVFFPLRKEEFTESPQEVVKRLANLFDSLGEAQRSDQGIEERMKYLREEEKRLAAKERWRLIREALGTQLAELKDLPRVFIASIGNALGEAAAKHVGL